MHRRFLQEPTAWWSADHGVQAPSWTQAQPEPWEPKPPPAFEPARPAAQSWAALARVEQQELGQQPVQLTPRTSVVQLVEARFEMRQLHSAREQELQALQPGEQLLELQRVRLHGKRRAEAKGCRQRYGVDPAAHPRAVHHVGQLPFQGRPPKPPKPPVRKQSQKQEPR